MAIEKLVRRHNPAAVAVGELAGAPRTGVAVVTCMDARIDPAAMFGVQPGDVHVLRNAGGVVTDDVERSLAISQRKLGTTQVMVVAHTRCGMATFTDEEFVAELQDATGSRPHWPVHTFGDPAQSVRDGVARLGSSPFLNADTVVRGYVFDVVSGELTEVS